MEPTRRYRSIVQMLRVVLFRWFRSVEVTGEEVLQVKAGGVLVAWHPNGLLDPAMILATCPRTVVFGARHGLFRVPVLGAIMRGLGVQPLMRAADAPQASVQQRRKQNESTLDGLAQAVAGGGFACLFPEGDSHDQPHLLPLKTGAARLFLGASSQAGEGEGEQPVIVPVGLHYDHKRSFKSHALVAYHAPMVLPQHLCNPPPNEDRDARRARAQELTQHIEAALHRVVHATDSWDLHHKMQRARTLIRAERAHRAGSELGRPSMQERTLAFARIWDGYRQCMETNPQQVQALMGRIGEYDHDMRAIQLKDHELDHTPGLRGRALLLLQTVGVFVLSPPLLLGGLLVNAPAVAAMWLASKRFGRLKKDEASIKVLTGALLLPASWGLAGALAWFGHEWLEIMIPQLPDRRALAAASAVALGIVGGGLAIRYISVARETARAVRVRLTRVRQTRAIAALRRERGRLCDELLDLAQHADLPGRVQDDGRVVPG